MGVFGQMHGHRDTGDDPAGYTCMMSNTNVPEGGGTEMGRFFVLNNLIYVKMVRFSLPIFNGLFLHGGSPIILGPGVKLKKKLISDQRRSIFTTFHAFWSWSILYRVRQYVWTTLQIVNRGNIIAVSNKH
jgi:hypothetical protein